MFYGEYEHSIDDKGRLIIPSKLRSPIKDHCIDQFVVTRGFDSHKCLYLFAPTEWSRIEKQFRSLPITQSKSRDFLRMFFSGAAVLDCDKQGRVLVPKKLLDYGGIEKDVMIIGVSSRFEIWDLNTWNTYIEEKRDSFSEMAENVVNLDLG